MNIIQNRDVLDDNWTHNPDDVPPSDLNTPHSHITFSLDAFAQHREAILNYTQTHNAKLGIRIPNTADVRTLQDDLHLFDLIALNFPKFTDGRAYSQAIILRDQLQFQGLLRATGDVLPDQIRHMTRCGFDQLALRSDKNPHDALKAYSFFTEDYQQPWLPK